MVCACTSAGLGDEDGYHAYYMPGEDDSYDNYYNGKIAAVMCVIWPGLPLLGVQKLLKYYAGLHERKADLAGVTRARQHQSSLRMHTLCFCIFSSCSTPSRCFSVVYA